MGKNSKSPRNVWVPQGPGTPLGRYAYGACTGGLPWQDPARTRCSGACHDRPSRPVDDVDFFAPLTEEL